MNETDRKKLNRIFEMKGELLKKALNIAELDLWQLPLQLQELLMNYIHKTHRLYWTENDITNEKYAMRVWLIQLGAIGDKYKELRKLLLRNLDGNSSWKNYR